MLSTARKVPYGQLILENAVIYGMDDDIVDQIFHFMVRDFSKYALELYHKPSATEAQMELCLAMIRKPAEEQVYALEGVYEMNA